MTGESPTGYLKTYQVFPGLTPDAVVDPTGPFRIVPYDGLRHGALNPLADPVAKRFEDWRDEEKNFVRTAGGFVGLTQRLRSLLLTHEMDETVYDTLMGISAALEGRHPYVRLRLEEVPEGATFKSVEREETLKEAIEMTNTIDKAVAKGVKQDSLMDDEMTLYRIKRAEFFSRLGRIRALRAQLVAWHQEDGGTLYLGESTPQGFIITDDGKLSLARGESTLIETD